MSSPEQKINALREFIREQHMEEGAISRMLELARHENHRLRDACRSTNRGITRLSKRCQSQVKKIAELKMLLGSAAAVLRLNDSATILRENIDIALHGRRPAKKAT